MRFYTCILILTLLGCQTSHTDNLSTIKWDFYKKNVEKYFIDNDTKTFFFQCNLNINYDSLTSKYEDQNCYNAEFTNNVHSSAEIGFENLDVPTINTICYNNDGVIAKYFLWDNALINDIVDSLELREDAILMEIIESQEVHDDLRRIADNR